MAGKRSGRGWQRGLSTSERGLGNDHQKARRRLLAELKDGDPCARCLARGVYHAMVTGWPQLLEVDDFPPRVVARALGIEPEKRLSWRSCNRRAGGILGNQVNGVVT